MDNIAKGCSGLLYLNLSYCYVTDSIIRILTKSVTSPCVWVPSGEKLQLI